MIGLCNKHDDLVFSEICEVSYFNFKKSDFTRFITYCENFKNAFNDFNFSKKQAKDLLIINKYLTNIFCFNSDEIIDITTEFFVGSHFNRFHEIISLSLEIYQNNNDLEKWLYSIK